MIRHRPETTVLLLVLAALALGPLLAMILEQPFLHFLLTRLMILAIAAVGLNLILGIAGLPSFGHAALMGSGGYVAGIITLEASGNYLTQGWIQVLMATAVAAIVATAMGSISLRTRGIAFILITLAIGQMLFYVGVSLDRYGGDDGITLSTPLATGGVAFYYSVFTILAGTLAGTAWLRQTPFGIALRGGAVNELRVYAAGIRLARLRLAAFTLSGATCGLAGALSVHHTQFLSPAMLNWTRSAELAAMVVLGGAGTLAGPLLGAGAFVVLEELLSGFTEHWRIVFGPLLVLVVLYARGGMVGWIEGRERDT